jgi:hypothetical protein
MIDEDDIKKIREDNVDRLTKIPDELSKKLINFATNCEAVATPLIQYINAMIEIDRKHGTVILGAFLSSTLATSELTADEILLMR